MKTKIFASGARNALGMAALGVLFAACGGKVIIDGAPLSSQSTGGNQGGAGAGSGDGGGSASDGSGGVGGYSDTSSGSGYKYCTGDPTCSFNDGVNCSCKNVCLGNSVSINCALTDTLTQKNVIQCVCGYDGVFSGVCYEKPGLACDFNAGCCAKYFSGK